MIIKEFYLQREDGINLYKTYSDQNVFIKQVETNQIFESAIDIESSPYHYVETDEKIQEEDIDAKSE